MIGVYEMTNCFRGEGMRTFIAIELTDELKEYIADKQQVIKKHSIKGNFSHKENFHLTLRFIGEINDNEIDKLKNAIDRTAEKNREFNLELGSLGYFPRKNKKIIWIGISRGREKLKSLFGDLEENLAKQGFQKEDRELRPHITIGREVKLDSEFDIIKQKIFIEPKKIQVEKISLMESTRINGKLTYIPIYTRNMLSCR